MVQPEIGTLNQGRPLVDLMINGHAHCFEYLQTANTNQVDNNIPCLVYGGSGYSLRRQREKGLDLYEEIKGSSQQVATSHLFIGRQGRGSHKHPPYYMCKNISQ